MIKVKKLYRNGYIFQRAASSVYRGIDGDNWYLNYCSENPYFEQFYDNNISKSWTRTDFVDCCTEEEYIQQCIQESKKLAIDYRVLLCATCKTEPLLEKKLEVKGDVLGFDCAYAGGSYYSCVLNDIISRRIEEFHSVQLNKNGLFETYEEAEVFLNYRENLKKCKGETLFESGEFVIYKITELVL